MSEIVWGKAHRGACSFCLAPPLPIAFLPAAPSFPLWFIPPIAPASCCPVSRPLGSPSTLQAVACSGSSGCWVMVVSWQLALALVIAPRFHHVSLRGWGVGCASFGCSWALALVSCPKKREELTGDINVDVSWALVPCLLSCCPLVPCKGGE
jgi:hypothetical protein